MEYWMIGLLLNRQKHRVKNTIYGWILVFLFLQTYSLGNGESTEKKTLSCIHGNLVNDTCVCERGWTGVNCHKCNGRISLDSEEGTISDGSGNYSLQTKCSWLIDAVVPDRIVWFSSNEFATECSWDHLYFHDGDSSFTPVLASISGLILTEKGKDNNHLQFAVNMSSRYLYVHFSSDAAYTMSGFNISYRVTDCHRGCSGQGECVAGGQCVCHPGFSGRGCETTLCPNNCSHVGECVSGVCDCAGTGFKGNDCSIADYQAIWTEETTLSPPVGRASHVSLVDGDYMWVVGGYTLSGSTIRNIDRYDFRNKKWLRVREQGQRIPKLRYGHASDVYIDRVYMYGGVTDRQVLNDLWVYDMATSNWTELSPSIYNVSGHSAHILDDKLYAFFGYSPKHGYLSLVQEYDIVNDTWHVVQTLGAIVQGGYAHSSVIDIKRGVVYVHGGYHSYTHSSNNLTDRLFMYNIATRTWIILRSSGLPRYLHSAVLASGLILVYGGNTHNDSSISFGAKCYSSDFIAYDIECNSWHTLPIPTFSKDVSRYGHTMVNFNNDVYMYGGFHGFMLNDLIKYTSGNCSSLNETTCETVYPGKKCAWFQSSCVDSSLVDESYTPTCDPQKGGDEECEKIKYCSNCEYNAFDCKWCQESCSHKNCSFYDVGSSNCSQASYGHMCQHQHNCYSCNKLDMCHWDQNSCTIKWIQKTNEKESEDKKITLATPPSVTETRAEVKLSDQTAQHGAAVCKDECSKYTGCENCTAHTCMWCSNMKQCVGTNSYVVSFPYGQCTDWTTKQDSCPVSKCSGLRSCEECQNNPMCGWCNDPSNTGLGQCMEGGATGAVDTSLSPNSSYCSTDRWYFTTCPACQCNGHSTCIANTSICESCGNLTEGSNCQHCKPGYYGNPENGGNCSECECNDQADLCDRKSGHCHCRTRGVTGKKCEMCDKNHSYVGDPKSGGTCYYQLVTDYQFTFNLSKPEDHFFTQINFMNIPASSDRDVDFTLNCSRNALINITYKSKSQPIEQFVVTAHPCDLFRSKFEHKDYSFGGEENTTFLVYVYSYETPFWLVISFSQFPKIDLVHFFITFFSCFLSLLLIAAALWKIKHKYDSYRRRQQLIVEMQQMASRPFAGVVMEMNPNNSRATEPLLSGREVKDSTDSQPRKRKKIGPGSIAIEPLHNNKAAILSLIIQLPRADEEFVPNGLTGIAVASTLVSLGNTRKQSVEHIRGDKSKLRKHLHLSHPETCA